MKSLKTYQDASGFIGHIADDGQKEFGDCSQRMGAFCNTPGEENYKAYFLVDYLNQCLLLGKDFEPVRYPPAKSKEWFAKPGCMSFDNYVALICAAGGLKELHPYLKTYLASAFVTLEKRYGFMWNTDIYKDGVMAKRKWFGDFGGAGLLAVFIRAIGLTAKRKWLWLLDWYFVFNAVLRVIESYFKPDRTTDDLNLFEMIAQATAVWPTWPMRLGAKIYFRYRLRAGEDRAHRLEGTPVFTAFQHYYRKDNAPPMDEVKRAHIEILNNLYAK
jgi:hypothetical protein